MCSENSNQKSNRNAIEVLNRAFKTPYSESIKKCLRICTMSEWKKELFKSIVNSIPSFNLFYNELPCVNQLKIKTSLDEFGISLISDETNEYANLLIHYYSEFLNQLFSDCTNFENLMFMYLVSFRKINSINEINNREIETSPFEKVKYFLSNKNLKCTV
jgi:hypothetical protein